MGRTLIAAKRALDHGQFLKMIEHDLPFDATTAQRLMKIARDPRIRKAARAQLLPIAWGTLYELSKLPDASFKQAVSSGSIHPGMTRDQARTVRVQVTHRTDRIVAPCYVADVPTPVKDVRPIYKTAETPPEPTDLPPPDVASLALSQIERLVANLAMAVGRGDVRADMDRIRAVADRLLALIADDDRRALN